MFKDVHYNTEETTLTVTDTRSGTTNTYAIQEERSQRYIKIADEEEKYYLIEENTPIEGRIATGDFKNCIFMKDANFNVVTFTQNADFSNATFTQYAHFYKATFTKDANFYKATFEKNADFTFAKFTQNADFKEAEFTQDAYFLRAKFMEDADFIGATFTQNAHFIQATFTQNAHFTHATFEKIAIFYEATFTKVANFHEAIFKENAVFQEAIFKENAVFQEAIFKENANFFKATFTQNAVFQEATFTQGADFNEAKFIQGANFEFMHCKGVLSLNTTEIHTLNMKSALLSRIDYKEVKIKNAKNRETFQVLKNVALQQNDTIAALDFHKKEMEKHFETGQKSKIDCFILGLEKLTSNFGTNPFLGILWLFLLHFVFGLIYPVSNDGFTDVFNAFIDSIYQTMTLVKTLESTEYGLLFKALHLLRFILSSFLVYEIIKSFRKYSRRI